MKRVLYSMVLFPSFAFADHICTNSPNEVYVGNTPAGQGQASMPICRWVQTGEAPQVAQMPTPLLSTYEWRAVTHSALAISYGEGVHGMGRRRDTAAAAAAQALERCAAAGGKACEIISGGQNGCLTVVLSPAPEGKWWTHFGPMGERTLVEREALEACSQGTNGQTCRVVQTVCERDRAHPGGVSTRPQPGVTYNGVRTPLSVLPPGQGGAHNCGPGRRPVLLRLSDRPGGKVLQMHCVPDSGDANFRAHNYADAAPIPRRFEWFEDRFGASAADADSDAGALAINSPTQAHADAQAIAACRADGGAHCEVVGRVQNACIALARGPGKLRHGQWGFSQEGTGREAVEECNKRAGHDTCTLMGAACSYGSFTGLREARQPEVSYRYSPPPQ